MVFKLEVKWSKWTVDRFYGEFRKIFSYGLLWKPS